MSLLKVCKSGNTYPEHNHSIVVGRDLWRSSSSPPCSKQCLLLQCIHLSLPQGSIAGFWSAWYSLGPSCSFLPSYFPVGWPSACAGAWSYSFSAAGLVFPTIDICKSPLCFTSYLRYHNHLVYQTLNLVLCHPHTSWGCTLSHHPGHKWKH